MKERRDAGAYVTKALITLHSIVANGIYDNDRVIIVSKEYLRNLELPMRPNSKFQQCHLKHFEYFCRIEYLKNGELSRKKRTTNVLFLI